MLAQEVNGEDVDRDQADAAVRPPPAIFGLVPPPRRACADDWAQLGQSGKATSTRRVVRERHSHQGPPNVKITNYGWRIHLSHGPQRVSTAVTVGALLPFDRGLQ